MVVFVNCEWTIVNDLIDNSQLPIHDSYFTSANGFACDLISVPTRCR
jgi:hypothetical protein